MKPRSISLRNYKPMKRLKNRKGKVIIDLVLKVIHLQTRCSQYHVTPSIMEKLASPLRHAVCLPLKIIKAGRLRT